MKASVTYAAVAAMAAVADARNLLRAVPEPTHNFQLPDDGVSPRPTQAAMELFRRADDVTTLWAPDNTCGYISGREGAAYTCNGDYSCAFEVSASTAGNVGCCSAGVCDVRYSCVNSEDYYSSSACDDGCAVDINTLKCTASSAPYCNTISFSGGITDYWCNNLDIATAQAANTTYDGGKARKFTTAATTSSVDTSTLTATSGGGQPTVTVHASKSSAASNDDDDDNKSSSNTGAIVGGVVGGVAGIALIAAAAWFFLRSKKKKQAAAAAAGTTPPAYQGPPMQQQPGTGPGGYNPVPQGQAGYYDPKNPYPSPGAQYQNTTAGYYQPGSPDPNQVDPRLSAANTSPIPVYNQQGYPVQQPVIHEAPADNQGRNETHELA